MSLTCKAGSFNVSTSAAGTTVAVTGVGGRPKFILFAYSGRTTTGNGSGDVLLGFGVQAGVNRWAMSSFDADGGAAVDSRAGHYDSACVVQHSATAQVGIGEVLSMDADGFTFIVRTAFTVDLLVSFLAVCGDEITMATAGQVDMTTGTGNQAIVLLNDQPDWMIFGLALDATGQGPGLSGRTSVADGAFSLGFVDTSLARGVCAIGTDDTSNPAQAVKYCNALEIAVMWAGNKLTTTVRLDITTLDSRGFTWNKLENGANKRLNFLAVKGCAAKFISGNTRTDGNDISTNIGFTPKAMILASVAEASNAVDTPTDGVGAEFSIGFATSDANRECQAISVQDGVTPVEGWTGHRTDAVYANPDLADGVEGLMDIKAGGFADPLVMVMDDADPAGKFWMALVLGDGSASSGVQLALAGDNLTVQ